MIENPEISQLKPAREWSPTATDGRDNLLVRDTRFNNPEWLYSGFSRNRDSDLVVQSNFETVLAMLKEAGLVEEEHWTVFHFRHWAFGWVDILAVHESSKEAVGVAVKAREEVLENSVLDEQDCSKRESEAADQGWKDWGMEQFQSALGHSFILDDELWNELNNLIPSDKWREWLNSLSVCAFSADDGGYSIDSFQEQLETQQFLDFLEENLGEGKWPPVELFFSGESDPDDFLVPDPRIPGRLTELPFLNLISKAYHDQGKPELEYWPEEWVRIPLYVPGEKEQPTLEL
jgi:hypothetical protein